MGISLYKIWNNLLEKHEHKQKTKFVSTMEIWDRNHLGIQDKTHRICDLGAQPLTVNPNALVTKICELRAQPITANSQTLNKTMPKDPYS